VPARFLTREQVTKGLTVSTAQVYALIRRKELRAAKIGGRGDYRIGRDDLEAFIERAYVETERWIDEHPFAGEDEDPAGATDL
jgi:excisionase family DNA binding protein